MSMHTARDGDIAICMKLGRPVPGGRSVATVRATSETARKGGLSLYRQKLVLPGNGGGLNVEAR
jgi:hypothetical protein